MPSRAELEAALAQTQADLAAAEAARDDAVAEKRSAFRQAVVVALVTGGLAVLPPLISHEEPVVDNCMEQRSDAVALIEKTGVWDPLPDDSVSEAQCDINDYVDVWQAQQDVPQDPAGP